MLIFIRGETRLKHLTELFVLANLPPTTLSELPACIMSYYGVDAILSAGQVSALILSPPFLSLF